MQYRRQVKFDGRQPDLMGPFILQQEADESVNRNGVVHLAKRKTGPPQQTDYCQSILLLDTPSEIPGAYRDRPTRLDRKKACIGSVYCKDFLIRRGRSHIGIRWLSYKDPLLIPLCANSTVSSATVPEVAFRSETDHFTG
jgi:hypothetical protein